MTTNLQTTISNTSNLNALNDQKSKEAKAMQQIAVAKSKSSNQIQEDINDRYNSFISAQQLSVEMLEMYRRQRKIMWIYVIVLVVLIGGLAYLYSKAYDPTASIFSKEVRDSQIKKAEEGLGELKGKASTLIQESKNKVFS